MALILYTTYPSDEFIPEQSFNAYIFPFRRVVIDYETGNGEKKISITGFVFWENVLRWYLLEESKTRPTSFS